MKITTNASLKSLNTFGVDAKANYLIEYESVMDLKMALKSEIVLNNKIFHIGGGSNLLFLNNFSGVILHSAIRFFHINSQSDNEILVEVGAGVVWDDFVAYAVENEWGGVENLSLIPGEVGAAAVQNIGAYGVEAKDVVDKVNTIEVQTGNIRSFTADECNYGYRKSIFKEGLKGKYIVTSVVFRLRRGSLEYTLGYQHLENEVLKSGQINLSTIRDTIVSLRTSKLPDPKITGNAGSFFMNPVIPRRQFSHLLSIYPSMPHYYVSETEEKVPAGWLIEQCGWKGKTIGNVGVHDRQALVLVNHGHAEGAEIANLAAKIRESVWIKFEIDIVPEVNYID